MKAKIFGAAAAAAIALGTALGGGDILIILGPTPVRWLTSTLNGKTFSSTAGIAEAFDIDRDFYVELVMRLDKSDPEKALEIAGFGGMTLRYLRGPFQLLYIGGSTRYCFNKTIDGARLRWPKSDLHHVILTSTGRVCRLYVDGELKASEDWSENYENHPMTKETASRQLWFAPSHEIGLYRVGYLSCVATNGVSYAGEDPATLVETHYNGGNPFGYTASAPTRLVDMRRPNFRMEYARNPVSGARLYPDGDLAGTLSWLTDDPYARNTVRDGAPDEAPRWVGQYWRDRTTGRRYVATGTGVPGDWRGFVYDEDLAAFPLKTLDGVSLTGSGDIVIAAAAPYREVVDVTVCGAVGDGRADDTPAIAEAVRQAKSSGKGVYFPVTAGGGTYRVTSPVALDGGLRVSGAPGALLAGEGTVFTVSGSGVRIADLAIAASGGAPAVRVTDATLVRVERLAVQSAGDALSVSGSTDVWIEDVDVSATGAGVTFAGSRRAGVVNGAFADCATGVAFGGGNAAVSVTGNLFADCATGVGGSAADTDLSVAQNVFDACTSAGVAFAGAKRVNVKGNVFRAFAAAATPIVCAVSYSAFSDNAIGRAVPDAAAADLVLTGSDAVTVGGNVMDGRLVTEGATHVAADGNLKAE